MPFQKSFIHKQFFKIGVLKYFAIFTGKPLCWNLVLIKMQALRPATLLKKRLQHRCFPVNIGIFLRTPILKNTSSGCFCSSYENVTIQQKTKQHAEIRICCKTYFKTEAYSEASQTSRIDFRCLTGFWIRLWNIYMQYRKNILK